MSGNGPTSNSELVEKRKVASNYVEEYLVHGEYN